MVNRGFAILGNKLFLATLDAHVIALDMGLKPRERSKQFCRNQRL